MRRYTARGPTPLVHQARGIEASMRAASEALRSQRPDVQLARIQIRAAVEELLKLDAELAQRESAGLRVADIAPRVTRTFHALHGTLSSPIWKVAYFARVLDVAAHLAAGFRLADGAFDPEELEALRLAVKAHGVGPAALAWFAITFPEDAPGIDAASLDRLAVAWTTGAPGGRWPVIADVWRRCFRVRLAPQSIKSQVTKLPK